MTLTEGMVNEQVRQSFTPLGVVQWWERPRHQLGGRSPRQAWEAGDRREVYDLAVAGRDMIAT